MNAEGMLKEHLTERSVTLESHSTEALGYYVPFCTFFFLIDWFPFIGFIGSVLE